MKTVTSTYLRNHIAETWDLAREQPIVVENHGMPEFVILSIDAYEKLSRRHKPREAGFAKHLFSGVDVNELLNTEVPGIEEYMPR